MPCPTSTDALPDRPLIGDQAHLPRIAADAGLWRTFPLEIIVTGIEFADQLVQLQRCLPDVEQKLAALASAFDGAGAVDRGIVAFVLAAAAIKLSGSYLQPSKLPS